MSEQRPGALVVTDRTGASYDGAGVRQVRATALGRGTHGVADIRRILETQLHVAFPHRVWVAGKVGEVTGAQRAPADGEGDVRFLLEAATEPDAFWLPCLVSGPTAGDVRELLHRSYDAVLEEVLQPGRLVRVGGLMRFDARRNAMVLEVSELDPTPAKMAVVDQREAALRAVTEGGLAAPQRTVACRSAPLDVAVVGEGRAVDSTVSTLSASGFAVRPRAVSVELTGADAPLELTAAVRRASQEADVVLLVRGPGRPLGLAVFDAVVVARAVAGSPVPVLTGLGGEQVRTTCDVVAFATLPTADEAARWVIRRLQEAEQHVSGLAAEIDELSLAARTRWRQSLESVAQEVDVSAAQAAERSEHARRVARRRLRIGGALLSALALAAAVVSAVPALAVLAVVAVLAVTGVELWWSCGGMTTRRRYSMPQRDDEFAQVLERLHTVREEMDRAASVERVAALRTAAAQLLVRGRELLGSQLGTPAPMAEPAEASPGPEAEAVPPGQRDGDAPQDGAHMNDLTGGHR